MSPNFDSTESLGKRDAADNGSRVFSQSKHSKHHTLGDQAQNFAGHFVPSGSTAPSLAADSGTSEERGSHSGSGSGSEDGMKSESPDKDCEYSFEERLPTLDTALHSVNLHLNQQRFQSQTNSFPTLPSLRDDPRLQHAFAHGTEYRDRPHLPRMSMEQAPHNQGQDQYQNQSQNQKPQQQPQQPQTQCQQLPQQPQQVHPSPTRPFEPSGPNGPNGPQGPSGSHQNQNQRFTINDEDITNKIASSSSDRPFGCPFEGCDWSFVRSSDQKRHLRSHKKATLQCPYWEVDPSCHRNGGAFNRLDVLKRHLKLMHYVTDRDGEVGQCKICNRYFNSLREFIDHTQLCANHLAEHRAHGAALPSQ